MGKLLSFLGIASAEDIASLKEDINKSTAHSISDCLTNSTRYCKRLQDLIMMIFKRSLTCCRK